LRVDARRSLCDLRWDDIDLPKRTIIVRWLKGSTDSVHYVERVRLTAVAESTDAGALCL
jgi:integrase